MYDSGVKICLISFKIVLTMGEISILLNSFEPMVASPAAVE